MSAASSKNAPAAARDGLSLKSGGKLTLCITVTDLKFPIVYYREEINDFQFLPSFILEKEFANTFVIECGIFFFKQMIMFTT